MRSRIESSVMNKELLKDKVVFVVVLLLVASVLGSKGSSTLMNKVAIPRNVSYNSELGYTSVDNVDTIDGKWVSVDGKNLLDIETNSSHDEVRVVIRDKYNVFNTIGKYSSDGNMIECDNGITVNVSSDKTKVEIDTANKESISFNRFV